jgi:hypothetical protein
MDTLCSRRLHSEVMDCKPYRLRSSAPTSCCSWQPSVEALAGACCSKRAGPLQAADWAPHMYCAAECRQCCNLSSKQRLVVRATSTAQCRQAQLSRPLKTGRGKAVLRLPALYCGSPLRRRDTHMLGLVESSQSWRRLHCLHVSIVQPPVCAVHVPKAVRTLFRPLWPKYAGVCRQPGHSGQACAGSPAVADKAPPAPPPAP